MAERSEGGGAAGDELLGRLEERLDRASEAAERLIAEAAGAALRRPPPAGWHPPDPDPPTDPPEPDPPAGPPDPDPPTGPPARGELELLLEALLSLRDRFPPELLRRLGDALRDLLLALRALIDWYLERSQRRPRRRADVQDIPIL